MQASPLPPAKLIGGCFWRVFHVVIQNPPNSSAVATPHSGLLIVFRQIQTEDGQ
jgi:hypothetical protein